MPRITARKHDFRAGADEVFTFKVMAFEAEPTPDDYTAIAQIAREVILTDNPSEAYDPAPLLQLLESGQRAVVLHEEAWHPSGNDSDPDAELPNNIVGFAIAHDRAEGRIDGQWAVERNNDSFHENAAVLLAWLDRAGAQIVAERTGDSAIIVNQASSTDTTRKEALAKAEYEKAREWLFMQRPLTEEDDEPHIPDDVVISRILTEEQKRTAHRVLEASFKDHFASHEETFEEFEARIDTYPGHDWAHDFLAEVEVDGTVKAVGALFTGWQPITSTALPEYLGVTSEARGRGVAKALFQAFFANARQFGFARAELEVDASSPTSANEIYEKMGFRESSRVETWHKTVKLQA